jgi:hypothetical protein
MPNERGAANSIKLPTPTQDRFLRDLVRPSSSHDQHRRGPGTGNLARRAAQSAASLFLQRMWLGTGGEELRPAGRARQSEASRAREGGRARSIIRGDDRRDRRRGPAATAARAVEGLEEPYRTAIRLRFFEDLPPTQIRDRLRAPVETVRTPDQARPGDAAHALFLEAGSARFAALTARITRGECAATSCRPRCPGSRVSRATRSTRARSGCVGRTLL